MKNVEVVELELHEDERGWVVHPVQSDLLKSGQLSNLHVPSIKPGKIRGNHYHQNLFEYALILSGPCKAFFFDNDTGEKWEVTVSKNKPMLFKISPQTTHAFKNIGQEDIYLICYNESLNNSQGQDLHRRIIIS